MGHPAAVPVEQLRSSQWLVPTEVEVHPWAGAAGRQVVKLAVGVWIRNYLAQS